MYFGATVPHDEARVDVDAEQRNESAECPRLAGGGIEPLEQVEGHRER
jgi:hypothetical protein